MLGHKSLIVIACFVLIQSISCASKPTIENKEIKNETIKSTIPCCYQAILSDIRNNILTPIAPLKGNSFNGIRPDFSKKRIELVDKEKKLIWLHSSNDSLSDWDDIVDWNTLKEYGVIANDTPFLILSAGILEATGLSANFTKWIVINCRTGDFSIKQSLSDSPDFFYVSSEKQMTFYLFDFSKEFLERRDYDNVSLDIDFCKVVNGKFISEKQRERKCKCR